jgi:RHS repeat-associated protein
MRKGNVPAGSSTFNTVDSTLIADSTEYQDWRSAPGATAFTRPVRQRIWLGGDWQPSQDISYDDDEKRPALPFRSSRYLSSSAVSVEETSYDSVFQLLPSRSRFYTTPQAVGATPSGNALDTNRFFDVDHGWILAKKDPGGRIQTTQYDRSGRPLTITNPDGGITNYSYVDRQEPTSVWRNVPGYQSGYPSQKTVAIRETDPSGVTTEARFDGLGRQVAVRVLAEGADPTVTDTARQHTTLFSYNIFDKLQWKRDPDAREEFHDYDGTGRLIASRIYLTPTLASTRSPTWESDYTYQDNLRTLVEQDALGTRTTFHWDALGRDTLIERDADTAAFHLRVGGEASAGVVAPAATSKIQVRQAYDNLGNLVRLADPKGLVETRHYDERNRLIWAVYPDDLRHAIGYDLASRSVLDSLQMTTHPESLTVRTSTYDAQDRPLTESFGTNLPENTTYAWDTYFSTTDPGRLLAVTRGTGVVASYVYDAMGRRTSRALSLPSYYGATQSWAYDLAGSPTRSDLPGTAHLSTGYDPFHRLGSVAIVHGSDSIPALHDLSYRPNDLLAGYGLGTRLTAKETYEAQRSVLTQSIVTKSVTGDTLYLQRMSWDGAGNVAGMKRNLGDSLGFDVDHLYQLREVHYPDGQALTVGYDLNGNRTKLNHPMGKGMMDTFALNGNRVTGGSTARKGWTVYRHDSRGNLSLEASFTWVTDTGNLALAWRVGESRFNKRNELVRVRVINRQNGIDTSWLRFDYGEDGNRIATMVSKGNDTTTWTTVHRWVYDGSVIAADSGSDHGWTWHAYNGLNRVAEATDSAGRARVRYVLTDHQGTVQALLSDTGAMLGNWVWDPWGNIEESWTQRTTDLLYQGKPYEAALGQWYFNARWYNPERGSFMGRDPKLQFWSPYNYVGNMPLTGMDPTGREVNYSLGCSEQNPDVEVLNINLTGVVKDNTAEGMGDLHAVRDWIQNRLQNQWTATVDSKESIHLQANLALEGAERPRVPNDHVFEIVDLLKNPDDKYSEAVMGNAELSGNHVSLTRSALSLEGSRTIGHEFGHSMGLEHEADLSQPNIMWQSWQTPSTRITPAIYSQLRGWAQ